MTLYHMNELIFELPDVLKDKTHHIFSLTDDGPSDFNLVISRNAIGSEETLQSYGTRLQAELAKALPRFEAIWSGTLLVADAPCWGLDYRWLNQGQWLHQRQASLFHEIGPDRRQVMQITATVRGEFTAHWRAVFDTMLGSMRLRQSDGRSG